MADAASASRDKGSGPDQDAGQDQGEATAIVRFTSFAALTEREIDDLKGFGGKPKMLDRNEVLVSEGDATTCFHLLLSGWTASSVNLATGARQLVKVHMPGDMLGLPALALTHSPDTIFALSPAMVLPIAREAIGGLFTGNPRVAALLFLISQEERVMLIDRLALLGAAGALERAAGMILQLHDRITRSHLDGDGKFTHPLSQQDLADLIGVTPVHINRILQQLRADGLIQWGRGTAAILDEPALRELAGLPRRKLNRELDWLPDPPE